MKILTSASSILTCILLLAGCDSLGIHNPMLHDQVPEDVKAQPLIVQTAPPVSGEAPWPRLGDVPSKPRDFSAKPIYDHAMDEMENDRSEAQSEKQQVDQEYPAVSSTVAAPYVPQDTMLMPPQFPKE